MNKDNFKVVAGEAKSYMLKSEEASYRVKSTLLIAASTILAVTSLSSNTALLGNRISFLFLLEFLAAISKMLCILSLGIALIGYELRYNELRDFLQKKVNDLYIQSLDLEDIGDYSDGKNVEIPLPLEKKIYVIFGYIGYISFACAVICLSLKSLYQSLEGYL